jgi:HEAT repeat protein
VVAAADGLAARGDKAACTDLAAAMEHIDPRARYHAVQAAGRLGCLSRQQLEAIARDDRSEDIRVLAAEFLVR